MPLRITLLLVCIFATIGVQHARAHGTPIHVDAAGSALTVSGGWPDTAGFAPMLFGEDDEDGDPFASPTLPQLGPVVLWQLPGLELFGMDNASSLSIEVLPRTVEIDDGAATENRLLWYWNPQTAMVEPALSDFYLLGTSQRSQRIPPADDIAPPPFLLAQTVTGQQGFHNHGLLSYALDNSPVARAGVYGFFARITASLHGPSDPFLLVFNHNVDYAQVMPAALAINTAALGPIALPGDYNVDGSVDAADYAVWRDTLGSSTELAADGSGNRIIDAEDYTVWRSNFGQSNSSNSANLAPGAPPGAGHAIPEPDSVILAAITLLPFICRRRLQLVGGVSDAE